MPMMTLFQADVGRSRLDVSGDVYAQSFVGNASTASKLATARTISLSGDASGSVSFDGSANASLSVTIADDSHNHTIANVDGLQTALNGKLASGANAVSASKLATARTIS
ncbi:phage tail fiber protein [Vibrio maritimus]|uniref:Phage tail fiber protein n=1 Tax=Vibrio maritimus TaxID=990268 RepID=A0A090SUC3_9VIBR|nr:phage tail fiber protein [Vibrio maritimus]